MAHLALVYHSVGLEDHIICAGLVFYLAQTYLQIFVAVHEEDLHGFKFLFRNQSSVRPLVVESYEYITDEWFRVEVGENVQVLRLGRHRHKDSKVVTGLSYAETFYNDANISYDIRWKYFLTARDFDLETAAYRKANVTSPFAFVYDDPLAGIYLDTSEIPAGIAVFNPRLTSRLQGMTIFDYGLLMERAIVIHTAESHLTQLAEHLSHTAERKTIHRYATAHRYAIHDAKLFPSYRVEWEIMEHPASTVHLGLAIHSPIHNLTILDIESSAIDIVFSIQAFAAIPHSCELYAAIDDHPAILLGSLQHPFPDSASTPCRYAFNGQPFVATEDGRCDMSASLQFDQIWSNQERAVRAHRGPHTLTLRAYGLYRQPGLHAAAAAAFRIDTVLAAAGGWFGFDHLSEISDAATPPAAAPPAAGGSTGTGAASGGAGDAGGAQHSLMHDHVVRLAPEENWGLNYFSQERLYLHHPVFSKMPRRARPVEPGYVTEFTGLRVPRWYDCGNLDRGGGMLGGYAYFVAVPSRWFPCYELEAMLRSGQRAFVPELPVMDEEYLEAAAAYVAALEPAAPGTPGRRLVMVELGARWGTWAFRAAAAAREYNKDVTGVDLLLVEMNVTGCQAIRAVAAANGFVPPWANVSVHCAAADAGALAAWAAERDVIDLVDMDIQGAECSLLPEIGELLRRKARRVIIGTHAEHDSPAHVDAMARAGLKEWDVAFETPFKGAPHIPGYHCLERTRHAAGDEWSNWREQARPECRAVATPSPYGPMLHWDGELILDNPDLAPPPLFGG